MTGTRTDRAVAPWALPREHRGVLLAYLAISAVNLVGSATANDVLVRLSKPLLVPLLLVWVLAVRRSAAPRALVVGLVLAWLGDLALMADGTVAFLVGLAFFLGMQVAYSLGFVRLGAVAVLRRRWWFVVGFALLWAGLNVVLGPSLGDLRLPLLVYSAALVTMAALACGVSTQVGVGGVLFLVSDLMIGLDAADLDVPAQDVLVMATYLAAQLLITTGWLSRDHPSPA